VEKYVGTYRTIYVDHFYTSIELMKSLADQNLFVTGTMMQNRLLPGVRVNQATYKKMKRGQVLKKKFVYKKLDGTQAKAGLTCWRDSKKLVYCLSNNSANVGMDSCHQRMAGWCWFTRDSLPYIRC